MKFFCMDCQEYSTTEVCSICGKQCRLLLPPASIRKVTSCFDCAWCDMNIAQPCELTCKLIGDNRSGEDGFSERDGRDKSQRHVVLSCN